MSAGLHNSLPSERLAGKWQIPAFALALIALTLSVVSYRSPAEKFPFDRVRDELPGMIDAGLYSAAIDAAGQLLEIPDKTERDLVPVHVALGRARLLRAERNGVQPPAIGRAVIEHYEQASDAGARLDGRDHELLGRAFEWIGKIPSAVSHYDAALAASTNPTLDLRRRVAELRLTLEGADGGKVDEELDGLIADAAQRPDVLSWALGERLALLAEQGRGDQAMPLVERVAPALDNPEWRGWLDYYRAFALYHAHRYERAEAELRHLRDRLALRDELFARTGWLLGHVVMSDDAPSRPVEAAAFFREVMSFESSAVYAAAAELGLAQSMVLQQRFERALMHFRGALERSERLGPNRVVNARVIESSLMVASDYLRRADRVAAALDFAELAARVEGSRTVGQRTLVLEHLSDLQVAVARAKRAKADQREAAPSPGAKTSAGEMDPVVDVREEIAALRAEARQLFLDAGATQQRIAALNVMEEDRAAAAAWRAAELIHSSGDPSATIAGMRRFIEQRPDNPFVSRALRMLGMAQQAAGDYAGAVETFQENQRRFPRTTESNACLVPLAQCFLAIGPTYADRAEKALRQILDDSEVFTPQAREYADALFLLGDLLNRTDRFEEAIPVLEEAVARYPDDARSVRAEFLLADCYRQSALALRAGFAGSSFGGEREQIMRDLRERLARSARLFDSVISQYEKRDSEELSKLDSVYYRHARLYEADCYFELGDYEQALARYERAAWIYRESVTALAAYVQIVNCHVFLGSSAEASAALRRAAYLVEALPDGAFDSGVDVESREDWRAYFQWVRQSQVF